MKKSRIIIIGFLILLIFAMPTLGKLLKINANDVQKIEISQDIYYLDDDSEALWTTVTDSKDIKKLVRAIGRPMIRKGFIGLEGGSRRKVVFHLTHGVKVELYLLQDRGVSLNGELYGFLFSFGGHRKVVYDDIDRILKQYEFSKRIPDEPVPPSDDVLAEYLNSPMSAGRIDREMYISQAYLITDAETDSYSSYLYFLFDNDEIRAVLNLSLSPDSEGHYANGTYLVNGEETITACFKRIIDEKLSFGLISTGGAYPLLVLCADDGCETIIDPVNERGNIDIEDTDEMFSLNCFERKNLELRKVSDIVNVSEDGTEDYEQPYGHQGNREEFTDTTESKVTDLWFIPGYKVIQSDETVLTLTEPYPFDYLDVGTQTLTNAVYYDNCLTVVFEGVKADGSEPGDSFGGSADDSDNGLTLIVDGKQYPCTGYITYHDERLLAYGMTCRFDLGAAMLSHDTEYTITFDRRENQNWYLEIPLTLKTAEHIDSMASIGEHYENEYVSVAVEVAIENDVLSAALYAVPKNDMELICIGGDGVSYASRGVVLLTGSKGEHVPSLGPYIVPKCYYPTVRNYDISGIEAAELNIPCVLLRDKVNESISKSFQTREEALEYTETIELEHCRLMFEIIEGKDGLEMICSAESLSEGLNLRSVETAEPSSSWLDPDVIRFPQESKPSELSEASNTLNESLSFSVEICGIIYEAETDFKIDIELQND